MLEGLGGRTRARTWDPMIKSHLLVDVSARQCEFGIPNLPAATAFDELHCKLGPRSADRTRSPAAVSQKREVFKCLPETIGYFAPKLPKIQSLKTDRQFAKARHRRSFLRVLGTFSLIAGLVGWRRRADRTRLHPFPANREFYGEFCDFRLLGPIS